MRLFASPCSCFLPLLLLLAVGLTSAVASAEDTPAESPAAVSFHKDVRPILVQHCQGCHQPAKPLGGLVLTSFADLQKGGESEMPGIVPGKPDESYLVEQITPVDGTTSMPKERPPLKSEQIEIIRRWIAEGAADDTPMSVRAVVDAKNPPQYSLPPVLTSVDYSPDGSLLAVSGYHEVLLHKSDGSEIVGRLIGMSERIESCVFSPDGQKLAVVGGSPGRFGEVQIWDVAKRELELSLQVGFDTLYGASWSHNGKLLAFGGPDNRVRAIEAATGKEVLQMGAHTDWVLGTVFSLDDAHLLSVSRDGSLKLTEVATQRFEDNVTSITPGALKGGLIAVDDLPKADPKDIDMVAMGGADGVPKIYRIYREKARVIGDDFNFIRAFEALPGRVFSVKVSRDGKLLAAGSSYDDDATGQRHGMARVYNVADAAKVSQFEGDFGPVYDLAFRPDAQQVAVVGFDGMVRLFDPTTGKLVTEFSAVPLTPDVAAK